MTIAVGVIITFSDKAICRSLIVRLYIVNVCFDENWNKKRGAQPCAPTD